jgi:DNA-binding LytR/AlgR family response regulator
MKTLTPNFQKFIFDDFANNRIVEFNDIIYCKAEGTYSRIYFQNSSILVSKVLKCFESILPHDIFFRIHRSYIININYVIGFNTKKVFFKNSNISIPVARRRKKRLLIELSKNHLLTKVSG